MHRSTPVHPCSSCHRTPVADTIIAVRLTPNDGLIQTNPDDNPDGHVVFQPFEGFNIEEHIDDTFEPRKLIDYRHEDEKE